MLAQSARKIIGVVFFASLILTACRSRTESEAPPSAEPQRGGSVVIGFAARPRGVNELAGQTSVLTTDIARQLFLQLVKEQPDFEEHPPTFVESELAEDYWFSEDRKSLTFRLRDNVAWSDGKPVTADDVRFTWEAQTNQDIDWPGVYMKKHITEVEVVDPKTVRFRFSHAYAKQMADANEGVILPKHIWGKKPYSKWKSDPDWFLNNLVVNGPFKIRSWSGQKVVLIRNEHYFRDDRPLLDEVTILVVPDTEDLMRRFLNGQIDFLPQIAPTEIAKVLESGARIVPTYWHRLQVGVVWNLRQRKFESSAVRRALTMAINRQAIIDANFPDGMGRVGFSPILQSVWAFNPSLKDSLPHDPLGAGRVLETHGWKDADGDGILDKDGEPFAFTLLTNKGNPQRIRAASMIKEDLRKVGILATPNIIEYNTLLELARARKFDAMIFGYTIDTSLDMTAQFGSGSGLNFAGYSNPDFDDLMISAMREVNLEDAKPHLFRIQQVVHNDQPISFLWESKRLSAFRPRLQNARPNALFALYNLQEWWVK